MKGEPITLKMGMAFHVPKRLPKGTRIAIARLVHSARYLSDLADAGGCVDLDASHLVDVADAVGAFESIVRRARASKTKGRR